jgi:hypothetical protein
MSRARPVRFFVLAAIAVTAAAFCACKDATPSIQEVQFKAVFDFASSAEKPDAYAFLFVRPDTDIAFADKIELVHIESGYTWTIDEPAVLKSGDKAWAGGPRLAYPEGAFRSGEYRVRYSDTTERESETVVKLDYPAGIPAAAAEAAGDALRKMDGSAERYALYDADGALLFFEPKREKWTGDAAVLADFPAAVSSRVCIAGPQNSAVVLLPPAPLKGGQ